MTQARTIFISHAHADNVLCEQIANALRQQGMDVWLDLHNAQKGSDLSEDIAQQLARRSVFLLMVTESSNASRWVNMELSNYIALYNDKETYLVDGVERRILPVRLESVPVPLRLRGFNWIEGVNKLPEQIALEIVQAFGVATPNAPTIVISASPPPAAPQIPIPSRLSRLGF